MTQNEERFWELFRKPDTKMRPCSACGTEFRSISNANRFCGLCKKKAKTQARLNDRLYRIEK